MEDLVAAIVPGATVAMDLAACEEADIRLVQLVGAARRHAGTVDANLTLVSPPAFDVERLLTRAGLADDPAEKGFWLQGSSDR